MRALDYFYNSSLNLLITSLYKVKLSACTVEKCSQREGAPGSEVSSVLEADQRHSGTGAEWATEQTSRTQNEHGR